MNTASRQRRSSRGSPATGRLNGKSIFVVEEEYLIASEAARALENVGAHVLGPYPSEEDALAALKSSQQVDCAIVDIRLSNGISFGVPAELRRKHIPFLFLTAINPALIPNEFSKVPVFVKPVDLGLVMLATATFFKPKRQLS